MAPTRQRLLEQGMRLFAEQGFGATSVADIEVAAGLQPRRGGMYKHFPSKEALLDAAVRSYLDRASAGAQEVGEVADVELAGVDPAALRFFVLAVGRWFLGEMDRLRDLTRVLEHDGRRMPELTAEIKVDIVDLSYRTAARLIVSAQPGATDPEAMAFLVLGPLVALRRTEWTFGSPPVGLDDERVLEAWAAVTMGVLAPPPAAR
jgi:AcrR family transcriptional regulator